MMHQTVAIAQRFGAPFPSSGCLNSALILLASSLPAIILFSDIYTVCFHNGFYVFKHTPNAVHGVHLI